MANDKTTVRGARRPPGQDDGPPYLRVVAGALVGKVFEVGEGETVIGKGTDAAIRLEDSGVSRRHAKLVRSADGMVVLIDLESTNGTFVHEGRIEMTQLRPGYRVGIGPDVVLEFGYGEPLPLEAPPPKPIEHSLTPRELDIARLVAEGLTNPKIAERLGIKPRTVSSHLDNIYARLRIGSRAALTRWVIEGRLL